MLERLQWAPKSLAASWDAQKPAPVALAGLRVLVEAQADHIAHLQARRLPALPAPLSGCNRKLSALSTDYKKRLLTRHRQRRTRRGDYRSSAWSA